MAGAGRAGDGDTAKEASDRDGCLVFDPEISDKTDRPRRRRRRAGPPQQVGVAPDQTSRRRRACDRCLGKLPERQADRARTGVLELLRTVYGRKPRPFQTLNFKYGTQQRPHADAVHFNTEPPGFMCGVWVAMEDIDADFGPLVYYPGSQRLPFASPSEAGIRIDPDQQAVSHEEYEAH